MKNWLPFVSFPLFDRANNPGSQNFRSGMISSSKYSLLKTDKWPVPFCLIISPPYKIYLGTIL